MLITVNRTKSVSCDHRLQANAPTDISSISILYKTSAKIKIARRKKRESAKCFFKCTSGQKDTRILIKRKLSQSREGYRCHYQPGISLNLRTGPADHATLFNQ